MPTTIVPGQVLKLSKKSLTLLEGSLAERIEDLEMQHRQMFSDHEVWWDWYEAKPFSSVRSDPWPNAPQDTRRRPLP